jgi:thioredoxin 1
MQNVKSPVVELTANSFDQEVLQNQAVVLIDVSTPWCPPCRMMAPVIEQIAADFPAEVKVCAVNLDDEFELGRKLNISAVPTFFIYRQGQLAERFQGAVSKQVLLEKLGLLTER